jgi:acetyl esterase/lipase
MPARSAGDQALPGGFRVFTGGAMSQDPPYRHLSEIPWVYPLPEADQVVATTGVEYARTESGPLTLDVYVPARRPASAALPAIVLVAGYSDSGYQTITGCRFKDMAMSTGWAKLVASFGMIAVTYGNARPAEDLDAMLRYLREHATELGIDADRLALWGLSGNGALALATLAGSPAGSFRCAVFSCAYLADLDGATDVAVAARQWRFTYPDGFRVENVPADLPVFIARAGQEQDPGLNRAVDRLVAAMLAANRPVTCANFAAAPHGFELFHDTLETREMIRQMMRFARFHLAGTAAEGVNV